MRNRTRRSRSRGVDRNSRAEWWKFGQQVGRFELVELLGLAKPLEPERAEAPESHPVGEGSKDSRVYGGRDENLTAVRGVTDPGGRVHGKADVAGVGQRGATAMDSDS